MISRKIGTAIPIRYFVYDGAFGHNDALQMVRQCGLYLISKLRYDSALWFPYEGPYSGSGPRKKYGDKLNYNDIPDEHQVLEEVNDGIQTTIYQMKLWHKEFADMLNIVVIVKYNMKTSRSSHIVLFCNDLKRYCTPDRFVLTTFCFSAHNWSNSEKFVLGKPSGYLRLT